MAIDNVICVGLRVPVEAFGARLEGKPRRNHLIDWSRALRQDVVITNDPNGCQRRYRLARTPMADRARPLENSFSLLFELVESRIGIR